MKSLTFALIASLALTACSVSPENAQIRRDALMEQVFPSPADRQGVFMAFPLESAGIYPTIEMVYFTQDVSEAEIVDRVSRFCSGQGERLTGNVSVRKDLGYRTVNTLDGQTRQVRDVFYNCEKRG